MISLRMMDLMPVTCRTNAHPDLMPVTCRTDAHPPGGPPRQATGPPSGFYPNTPPILEPAIRLITTTLTAATAIRITPRAAASLALPAM